MGKRDSQKLYDKREERKVQRCCFNEEWNVASMVEVRNKVDHSVRTFYISGMSVGGKQNQCLRENEAINEVEVLKAMDKMNKSKVSLGRKMNDGKEVKEITQVLLKGEECS